MTLPSNEDREAHIPCFWWVSIRTSRATSWLRTADFGLRLSSASGLGLATVHELLKAHAYVSILDRATPSFINECSSDTSQRVMFVKTDIGKVDEIESAVERTAAWAKETGAPLGGVINAAGIAKAELVRSYSRQLCSWISVLLAQSTSCISGCKREGETSLDKHVGRDTCSESIRDLPPNSPGSETSHTCCPGRRP